MDCDSQWWGPAERGSGSTSEILRYDREAGRELFKGNIKTDLIIMGGK